MPARKPLTRTQIAETLQLGADTIDRLAGALAANRHLRESLLRRVNLEYATGRTADEAGDDCIDPPPIAVKLLKAFAGFPPGSTIKRPYREAVSLINEHIAEPAPS